MEKTILGVFVLLLTVNLFAVSQSDLAHAKALEVIKLTNADKMAKLTMKQMVSIFKKSRPEISNDFWEKFIQQADYQGFSNMIADIYAENYTVPELDAMIKFYSSPIGQEIIKKQPQVSKAAMIAGQKWGQQLGMKIALELQLNKPQKNKKVKVDENSIQKK
ncbi:MAG: DUF2059 domain-containing protein [bacterium]|nr:DUF2059 domain-containing protein [bacterium]